MQFKNKNIKVKTNVVKKKYRIKMEKKMNKRRMEIDYY